MRKKANPENDGSSVDEQGRDKREPAFQGSAPAAPSSDGSDPKAQMAEAARQPAGPMAMLLGETKEALAELVLRLRADLDNLRKRTFREKEELGRRASEQIIRELLPVVDHMEMAVKAARNGEGKALVEGFDLVREQFLGVLKKFGLTSFDAAGQVFDPNIHEAVSYAPSETVGEGKVLAEVQKGYFLGNRLLRPARVVVSSGQAVANHKNEPEDKREKPSEVTRE